MTQLWSDTVGSVDRPWWPASYSATVMQSACDACGAEPWVVDRAVPDAAKNLAGVWKRYQCPVPGFAVLHGHHFLPLPAASQIHRACLRARTRSVAARFASTTIRRRGFKSDAPERTTIVMLC